MCVRETTAEIFLVYVNLKRVLLMTQALNVLLNIYI